MSILLLTLPAASPALGGEPLPGIAPKDIPNAEAPTSPTLTWQQVWQLLALHGYVHLEYGTYLGRYGGIHTVAAWNVPVPQTLQTLSDTWGYSPFNPAFRSGLIQFERADHLLAPGGISRGRVLPALSAALKAPNIPPNPYPFQWVEVHKNTHPETLDIWQAPSHPSLQSTEQGRWIFHTVVNTGVLHSTPDGSWPIYQRLSKTTMRGKFPIPINAQRYHLLPVSERGTYHGHLVYWQKYVAPNVRFVNYFYDGRAIHFYPRKGYGWPQSAGCVEEPLKDAQRVFELLHYGDIVSIIGHYSASPVSKPPASTTSATANTRSAQLKLLQIRLKQQFIQAFRAHNA